MVTPTPPPSEVATRARSRPGGDLPEGPGQEVRGSVRVDGRVRRVRSQGIMKKPDPESSYELASPLLPVPPETDAIKKADRDSPYELASSDASGKERRGSAASEPSDDPPSGGIGPKVFAGDRRLSPSSGISQCESGQRFPTGKPGPPTRSGFVGRRPSAHRTLTSASHRPNQEGDSRPEPLSGCGARDSSIAGADCHSADHGSHPTERTSRGGQPDSTAWRRGEGKRWQRH